MNYSPNSKISLITQNITEIVPSNEEASILLSEIQTLANKISCESVQHLGSLEDYEKIITGLNYDPNTVLDLNIDLSPLENFAALASNLTSLLENIELKFDQVYTISYIDYIKKIYEYLKIIDSMLNKYSELIVHIKSKITFEFSTPLTDINDQISEVLHYLNDLIYKNADDCELRILKCNIKKENCLTKKINRKLGKFSEYQCKMDSLIKTLSSKNKHGHNC